MTDLELQKEETLVVVYVRVKPVTRDAWRAVLVDTGKEYFAPTRALALHAALKGVECT